MKGTIVPICCGFFFLALTAQIRDATGAQTFGRGGIAAPFTDTCYYDGTTTTADALIALTQNQEKYGFIQFPRQPAILAVAVVNLYGVPGIGSYLSTIGVIGYTFQLSSQIYFLNFVGCPTLTLVSNTQTTVYGYPLLFGCQVYQVYAALNTPATYGCSLCSSNDLASYVYEAAPGQGLNVFFVGTLQSFVVFQYGISVANLQSNIKSILRASNVSGIVSEGQGYVTVYDQKSVTRNCVFPPATNAISGPLSSAVRNPNNFSGKRNICKLAISIAATEVSLPSYTTTVPVRLVLPLSDGQLIVIACYALRTIFDSIYLPLLQIC